MQDQVEGKKYDQGKPRWSLLPEGMLPYVVAVLEHGAHKYGADNWKHVPDARRRYYDAAMRHIDAWWGGQIIDDETENPHLAHAICCMLFLMWLDEQKYKDLETKDTLYINVSGIEFP